VSVRVLIVATESIDVLSWVRAECSDKGRVQWVILLPEVMQCPAEREDIVKDDTVGDEVIVLGVTTENGKNSTLRNLERT